MSGIKFATRDDIKKANAIVAKGIFPNPDYYLIMLHTSMLDESGTDPYEEVVLSAGDAGNKLFVAPELAIKYGADKRLRDQRIGHPILACGENCEARTGAAFLDHGFTESMISAFPMEDGWLDVAVHRGQVMFSVEYEVTEYLNNETTITTEN